MEKSIDLICLALQERGEPPPPQLRSYYDVISCDEDATLRTIIQITTGITGIADPVQGSLEHFEKR
jgi:dynein heavy chain